MAASFVRDNNNDEDEDDDKCDGSRDDREVAVARRSPTLIVEETTLDDGSVPERKSTRDDRIVSIVVDSAWRPTRRITTNRFWHERISTNCPTARAARYRCVRPRRDEGRWEIMRSVIRPLLRGNQNDYVNICALASCLWYSDRETSSSLITAVDRVNGYRAELVRALDKVNGNYDRTVDALKRNAASRAVEADTSASTDTALDAARPVNTSDDYDEIARLMTTARYRESRVRGLVRFDDATSELRRAIGALRCSPVEAAEVAGLFRHLSREYLETLYDLSESCYEHFETYSDGLRDTVADLRRATRHRSDATVAWLAHRLHVERCRAELFRAFEYTRAYEIYERMHDDATTDTARERATIRIPVDGVSSSGRCDRSAIRAALLRLREEGGGGGGGGAGYTLDEEERFAWLRRVLAAIVTWRASSACDERLTVPFDHATIVLAAINETSRVDYPFADPPWNTLLLCDESASVARQRRDTHRYRYDEFFAPYRELNSQDSSYVVALTRVYDSARIALDRWAATQRNMETIGDEEADREDGSSRARFKLDLVRESIARLERTLTHEQKTRLFERANLFDVLETYERVQRTLCTVPPRDYASYADELYEATRELMRAAGLDNETKPRV